MTNRKKSRIYREQFTLAEAIDNPFATFSEWTSGADEKAYAGLTARRRKDESARDTSRKSN